jgi:hypothetical protein
MNKPKLRNIIAAAGEKSLAAAWGQTAKANEFGVLPVDWYVCHITEGKNHSSRKGTLAYVLTFQVIEGPYKDRKVWLELWITAAAAPSTKRDLEKLGVPVNDLATMLDWLDTHELPQGIRCKVRLGLRNDSDDGVPRNRVLSFEVLGHDAPPANPFPPAPAATPSEPATATAPAPEPTPEPTVAPVHHERNGEVPKKRRGRPSKTPGGQP